MRTRSAVVAVLLFGAFGLTAGCGADDSGGRGTGTAGTSSAAAAPPAAPGWPPFDPPTRFDLSQLVSLPPGSVAKNVLLYGTTAFVGMDDGLVRVDLPTGKAGAAVRTARAALPVHYRVSGGHARTPVLAELAGRPVVVLPVVVTVAAVGTNPKSHEVDVVVADAATGKAVSVVQVDLADGDVDPDGSSGDDSRVKVVGVRGSTVVISAGERVGLAVDLAAGKLVWRRPNVRVVSLIGDTVVGESPPDSPDKSDAVGLALADGQPRWTALPTTYNLQLVAAGPNFVMATGGQGDTGFFVLIRPDGSLAARNKGEYIAMNCRYDEVAATVCFSDFGRFAFGLDSTTNAVLWTLPQEGSRRVVPQVTAVWHGAVYGTANRLPVVLDARTGADKDPEAGLAPVVVNAHAAVIAGPTGGQNGEAHAYRALG